MIIEMKDVVKRYKGDVVALNHLNLQVKEGEILGLLGANGSGKSTTINCLLSLLKIQNGEIYIFGKPMSPDAYDIKKDIGLVPQEVAVFAELNVVENITYFCSLYIEDKETCKKYVEEAIQFVGLDEFRKFLPKKLSGGLKRRLNIACGIAHKPKLIILDEPTVAVDPQSRNMILENIRKLNEQGSTIVYTSHYMEEVEELCNRIVIIDHGQVIADGTREELVETIALKETIKIEQVHMEETCIEAIRALPNCMEVQAYRDSVVLKFHDGSDNISNVIQLLKEYNIPYGTIGLHTPSLNDVFLEITGRDLRD